MNVVPDPGELQDRWFYFYFTCLSTFPACRCVIFTSVPLSCSYVLTSLSVCQHVNCLFLHSLVSCPPWSVESVLIMSFSSFMSIDFNIIKQILRHLNILVRACTCVAVSAKKKNFQTACQKQQPHRPFLCSRVAIRAWPYMQKIKK